MAIQPKVNVKVELKNDNVVITDMDSAFRNAIVAQNNLEPDVIITESLLQTILSLTLRSEDFGGETLNSLKYLELLNEQRVGLGIKSEDWTASNYDNILDTVDWVRLNNLSKKFHIYVDNQNSSYSQGKLLETTNPDFESVESLTYDNDSYITIEELKQNIINLKPLLFEITKCSKVYNSMSDLLENHFPKVLGFTKIRQNFRIDNFSLPFISDDMNMLRLWCDDRNNLEIYIPNGFQGLTYCKTLWIEGFNISTNDVLRIVNYMNTMSQEKILNLSRLRFDTYETFMTLADSATNILKIDFYDCSINGNPITQNDLDALQALKPNWNITFN